MVVSIEQDVIRTYTEIASNFASTEFVYILKAPETVVTADNFHTAVQTGSVLGKTHIKGVEFFVGYGELRVLIQNQFGI